jgi:Domain of unknown function (DUF4340)
MNDLFKTTIFAGVAVVLTGLAVFSTRDRQPANAADFDDQGKPFFAEFKDPLACTDLEVVDFDSSTATASRFRVMFKDNKWVIPSHYNYPADARDRLSNTAAAIMDLTKDTIRSNSPDEQEAMGVIDPLDSKVSTLTGRGKRITLRDASEKVVADIVIGNEIKGTERKDGGAQRYVRAPDQKRTYGVNIKAEPSTRFADWIETNLLKVETSKIRRIFFDNYKIQENPNRPGTMMLQAGEKLTITRKEGSGPWTMAGTSAGEQLNEDNLRKLSDAVADLKIVGIRPRPEGLSDLNKEDLKVSPVVMSSLINKGFFLTRQGLFSDQGDVAIGTDEGVVYTLRYGGPVFAEGDELVVGAPDDAEQKKDAGASKDKDKDKAKKPQGAQENRFLMVTVSFDPTLIERPESIEPKPFTKPAPPATLPENVIAPDPKDPKFIADQKAAEDKKAREKTDYEKKIADGKKKVDGFIARFGPWYYVTPGDSFRAINLDRVSLVEPKKPPGADGAEGGTGGFPGGGLPKGFPPLRPQG